MSVRTVRFNREEDRMLQAILSFYKKDFSNCMKQLLAEKLEDLRDVGLIKKLREGKPSDYHSADDISGMF